MLGSHPKQEEEIFQCVAQALVVTGTQLLYPPNYYKTQSKRFLKYLWTIQISVLTGKVISKVNNYKLNHFG